MLSRLTACLHMPGAAPPPLLLLLLMLLLLLLPLLLLLLLPLLLLPLLLPLLLLRGEAGGAGAELSSQGEGADGGRSSEGQ